MPSEPVVYDDTYPAISPENFSFKGEVALITGNLPSILEANDQALEGGSERLPQLPSLKQVRM
jgi:hypothetical protein